MPSLNQPAPTTEIALTPAPVPALDVQLKAYELGLKETDQIIAIQNHTATVGNILLVVTGAIWAALLQKETSISTPAVAAVLILHIVTCFPALQLLISNTHAIDLRFKFLASYSRIYYPDIEDIGKAAFRGTYGATTTTKGKYFRWGRSPWLWYFIPIVAACGSAYFLASRFL
jgi:hypothetical protein